MSLSSNTCNSYALDRHTIGLYSTINENLPPCLYIDLHFKQNSIQLILTDRSIHICDSTLLLIVEIDFCTVISQFLLEQEPSLRGDMKSNSI